MYEFVGIALRVSFIYVYVLIVLRLSGKRSIDHVSPFDVVLANAMGDMFDDMIWAEVPLAQGVVGITTLLLLHMLVSFAVSQSDLAKDIFAGRPTWVIRQGKLQQAGLAVERTRPEAVFSAMREQSEDVLAETREAAWEPAGRLSALKVEPAKAAQKRDLPMLRKVSP